MSSPFDYLNAINYTKEDLIRENPKDYSSYMVNRGLSFFQDTILAANEMNINEHLADELKFDFLINIISKRKRFSKWAKLDVTKEIEMLSKYFSVSLPKARDYAKILTDEQIKTIKDEMKLGGKK